MAATEDLSEAFARELQRRLVDDPELRDEFFATDEFPTDDLVALRGWVSDQISEAMPESPAIAKFLRRQLKASEVVGYLRDWN